MTDEHTDQPSVQTAIDTAAQVPVHMFNGKPLYAFNHARMTCWQRIGFDGAIHSSYDALVSIVFICTLGMEIVETVKIRDAGREKEFSLTGMDLINSTRTEKGIREFQDRACAWADGLNMTPKNAIGIEANDVGFAIYQEMESGHFAPVPLMGLKPPPNG